MKTENFNLRIKVVHNGFMVNVEGTAFVFGSLEGLTTWLYKNFFTPKDAKAFISRLYTNTRMQNIITDINFNTESYIPKQFAQKYKSIWSKK
jgi:hypothetical protein